LFCLIFILGMSVLCTEFFVTNVSQSFVLAFCALLTRQLIDFHLFQFSWIYLVGA
jgi:hypothetical protein